MSIFRGSRILTSLYSLLIVLTLICSLLSIGGFLLGYPGFGIAFLGPSLAGLVGSVGLTFKR